MSDDPTLIHDPGLESEEDIDVVGDDEELPARPRRRLLTPATGLLGVVALAAGGFLAGVEVQKHHGSSGPVSAGAGGLRAAFGAGRGAAVGGGFAAGGQGARPTIGTVANKHGSTLYVTSSAGATVRVKASKAKVTRTAGASVKGVFPGDTVIVQGTTASDGTVTATQLTATAKGAAGAGAFGGFARGLGGGRGGSQGGGLAGGGVAP